MKRKTKRKFRVIDCTEYNEATEQKDREAALKAVFESDVHTELRRKRDLNSEMDRIRNPPIQIKDSRDYPAPVPERFRSMVKKYKP